MDRRITRRVPTILIFTGNTNLNHKIFPRCNLVLDRVRIVDAFLRYPFKIAQLSLERDFFNFIILNGIKYPVDLQSSISQAAGGKSSQHSPCHSARISFAQPCSPSLIYSQPL